MILNSHVYSPINIFLSILHDFTNYFKYYLKFRYESAHFFCLVRVNMDFYQSELLLLSQIAMAYACIFPPIQLNDPCSENELNNFNNKNSHGLVKS